MERWRGEADEPVEQRESVEAAEESGDFWDDILAGEAAAIEAGEVTDWDLSEAEELEPADEPEKTYRGGRYRDLPTEAGIERHHLVARESLEAAGVDPRDGPAIQMMPKDHAQTESYGAHRYARHFRAEQTRLLLAGRSDEAFALGVLDVHTKFGPKYQRALEEAVDAAER